MTLHCLEGYILGPIGADKFKLSSFISFHIMMIITYIDLYVGLLLGTPVIPPIPKINIVMYISEYVIQYCPKSL